MKKTLVGIVTVLALVSAPLFAQEKPAEKPAAADAKTTTLSLEQKQAIQLAAKDIEIAQLHAQQAAADYNVAREKLSKLVAAYVPAGYQLNEQLELVKVEPPKKDEPKKDPPK